MVVDNVESPNDAFGLKKYIRDRFMNSESSLASLPIICSDHVESSETLQSNDFEQKFLPDSEICDSKGCIILPSWSSFKGGSKSSGVYRFVKDITTPPKKLIKIEDFGGKRVPSENICFVKKGRPGKDEKMKRINMSVEKLARLQNESDRRETKLFCPICNCEFPRIKSLRVHIKTHTEEKDYACSYPFCKKRFIQPGQLNTHLRTHTKEKPYLCSAEGCTTRHAHSNRTCPDHKGTTLIKSPENLEDTEKRCFESRENMLVQELNWLKNYFLKKKSVAQGISPEQNKSRGMKRRPDSDAEVEIFVNFLSLLNEKRDKISSRELFMNVTNVVNL